MAIDDVLVQRAADLICAGGRLTVLTGAGISKESGIPTFRDALDGLWASYDPRQLATESAFRRSPKLVWDFYEYRRELMRPAQPNPGHLALAALEKRFPTMQLITQNVDDLHERAGSQNVIRLHGSIAVNRCFFDCQGEPTVIDVSQIDWDRDSGPPPCPHCGRWVRPGVVWFGEVLPSEALYTAKRASMEASVMLVIGTSGMVTPAADLPYLAKRKNAKVIEINPLESEISPLADLCLRAPAGVVLPRLLERLG